MFELKRFRRSTRFDIVYLNASRQVKYINIIGNPPLQDAVHA